jgi:hypothetical protein
MLSDIFTRDRRVPPSLLEYWLALQKLQRGNGIPLLYGRAHEGFLFLQFLEAAR